MQHKALIKQSTYTEHFVDRNHDFQLMDYKGDEVDFAKLDLFYKVYAVANLAEHILSNHENPSEIDESVPFIKEYELNQLELLGIMTNLIVQDVSEIRDYCEKYSVPMIKSGGGDIKWLN